MPKLTVDNKTIEVPAGKRMVNALIDEAGIDQLHACGGNARCTTCRVKFIEGQPSQMTQAEKDVMTSRGLIDQTDVRLSCQLTCDTDMKIEIISRLQGSGRKDAGNRPADDIQPPPVWITRD